jgi:MFS family permease
MILLIGMFPPWDRKSLFVEVPFANDRPRSAPKRYYVAALGCLGIFMCTFLAGGPGIAIPEMTITYFGPPGRYFAQDIAKVAYFLTVMPLTQGVGELFWMPLTVKYGRRPIYVASFALYTVTSLWAGFSPSYSSELAARIIMGCASGAAECLAPLTITDVFFLHQRGTMMRSVYLPRPYVISWLKPLHSLYTASIACGAASGIIISGFITEHHTWRYIFHLSTAIIGTLTLLFFFTMPETMYQRDNTVQPSTRPDVDGSDTSSQPTTYKDTTSHLETKELEHGATLIAKKHSYGQDLRLFHVTYTKESFLRLFLRPIGLLLLPPILWAALVESATIGFYIAISSNFAVAFGEEYHFATWKIGLTYLSSIIGAILAIAFGGFLSDAVADFCTARNGGIREPEMRIPAIAISVITAPLGLVLYGVGIQNHLHWMVPTLGIGLCMSCLHYHPIVRGSSTESDC